MELNVKKISYELKNENYLSYLFFECENQQYFTISKTDEDEEVYLELNNQFNGEYFNQDCFNITFLNCRISFSMNLNNKKLLSYLNEHNKNAKLYENIVLIFEPVSVNQFKEMIKVLHDIFNKKFHVI